MDKAQEEAVIKAFCYKNKQKRILYELFSEKKRENYLSDLCHTPNLIPDYMIEVKKPCRDSQNIYNLLKSYGAPDMCYIICWGKYDGEFISLIDAIRYGGNGSLISCIPGKLAYWEGEQSYGPPPRYILYRP